MAGTPDNLSYCEDYACPHPYEPRKPMLIGMPPNVGGGSEPIKEGQVSRTRVSLSACLNIEEEEEPLARTSNASASSAFSAYSAYSHFSVPPRSPGGPVLLMQPPINAPVACGLRGTPHTSGSKAQSELVASPLSTVDKKKHTRSVDKEKREKVGQGSAVNPDDSSTWTTRMLRNLPNDYSRQDLLDLLDSKGIQYDFIYLPIDWGKRANLGYSFVNLVCPQEALKIDSELNGFTGWNVASEKVCEVVWGKPDQQSLRKNVERFRNSPVMHPDVPDEFKPLLFTLGKRSVFPAPTKRLRPPRGFQRKEKATEQGAQEMQSDDSS